MWMLIFTLGILGLSEVYCEEEKVFRVSGTDSYLEAYKASRGDSATALLDDAVKKTDREYIESSGYPYPNPQPQYGPPSAPGGPPNFNYAPRPSYGPPNPPPVYGAPSPSYGPPISPSYGPPNPAPVYGPPNPPPVYGPPPVYNAPSSVQVFYGVPHAMVSFWDKLKAKLDLFTIGKILLKLIIFKKIVSFIAIICLLLFIPALKHKGNNNSDNNDNYNQPSESEDDDMFMMRRNTNGIEVSNFDEKLDNLAAYVRHAIENVPEMEGNRSNCDNVYCRTQKVLKKLNKKTSYKRLAMLYSKELRG